MSSPTDYLPPEWHDEERMRVLLGPMPLPHDAVARKARCTFWSAAIHHWCRVKLRFTFTFQECQRAFRRGTQNPLSLPGVLLHMNSLGEVIPVDQLPQGERSVESWAHWGYRVLVVTPFNYSWSKLKEALGVSNILETTLVNTLVLQEMCNKVYKICSGLNSKSAPLSLAELYNQVGESVGSVDNLYLIVATLANKGLAAVTVHSGTTYVKFAMPGDTDKPSITQVELAEKDLLCAQQQVEDSVTQLCEETANLRLEAKRALSSGSKPEALSMLKRKKRLEKSLTTQLGALENITSCIQQLQDTRINKQVLEAFRVGVEALRTAVSGDTSPDSVAETMDDVQQVLDECQDVSSVLAAGIKSPDTEEDEDTLLSELNRLLEHEEGPQQVDQQYGNENKDLQLPDVPKRSPLSSFNLSSEGTPEKFA